MKKQKTMNDIYGDGSNHVVCDNCGFCVTCGDCKTSGCGKKRIKFSKAFKQKDLYSQCYSISCLI